MKLRLHCWIARDWELTTAGEIASRTPGRLENRAARSLLNYRELEAGAEFVRNPEAESCLKIGQGFLKVAQML